MLKEVCLIITYSIDSQRLTGCILDGGCSSSENPISLFIPVDSLIVKEESDCVKLLDHSWSSIIIGDELCNTMTSSLHISAYMNLTYLEIGSKSLTNISSLIIENNPLLTTFITIEFDSCSNVEELVIQSSCIFLILNRFTSIISF